MAAQNSERDTCRADSRAVRRELVACPRPSHPKHSAAGGYAVGCDISAWEPRLRRCAGALSRAGVPRVARGTPASPAH